MLTLQDWGALSINRLKETIEAGDRARVRSDFYSEAVGKRPPRGDWRERRGTRVEHKVTQKGKVVEEVRLNDGLECSCLCVCVGWRDIFKEIEGHTEQVIHRDVSLCQSSSKTGGQNKTFVSVPE